MSNSIIHFDGNGIISLNADNYKAKRECKGRYIRELPSDYTLIDIETTGTNFHYDDILEVSAIKVKNHDIESSFSKLIKTEDPYIPEFITKLTGITTEMLLEQGYPSNIALSELYDFIGDDILLGYNVNFDINFLYDAMLLMLNKHLSNNYVDILQIARKIEHDNKRHRLMDMLNLYKIDSQDHRSYSDCLKTKEVYDRLVGKINNSNITLNELFPSSLKKKAKDYSVTVDQIDNSNLCFDKNFCFTGKMDLARADAYQLLKNLGATPQDNVTTKTDYLVLGDITYSANVKGNKTGKMKKATDLIGKGHELQVITETDFVDMIQEIYINNTH